MVDGVGTNRADTWMVSDFSKVITGAATEPTVVSNGFKAQTSTLGNHSADVASLTAGTYSMFSFQGYRSTDRVKSLEVDLGCYNGQNRGSATSFCLYYDPITGQSLFLTPHNQTTQGTQLALYYCKSGAVTRVKQIDNGYNPGDTSTCTSATKSLWMRLVANYTYDVTGALSQIYVTVEYYSDSTYSAEAQYTIAYPTITMKTAETGDKSLGKFFANTGLTAETAFNAGILVSTSAAAEPKVAADRLKITYSRALSAEDSQRIFEDYYNENGIGDKAALAEADNAVIEQALTLYNGIPDTHKGNVADKYAKILDLVKTAYVHTTAAEQTIKVPSAEYGNITAIVNGEKVENAHVLKMTGKVNAYDIFNNDKNALDLYILKAGDSYIQIKIERTTATVNSETVYGLKIARNTSADVTGNLNDYNNPEKNFDYRIAGIGTQLGLQASSSADYVAMCKALFTDANPLINADSKYLNFQYEFENQSFIPDEANGWYTADAVIRLALYYDANQNDVFDEGEYALTNFGYNKAASGWLRVKNRVNEEVLPNTFAIEAAMDTFAKDFVVVSEVHADATPAELFVEQYGEVLNAAAPAGDDALAMYVAYNALAEDVKAEVNTLADVAAVLDKANVRPTTAGATIRTGIDQNIAFYTKKPVAETTTFRIKEMGSVICGLGYAIENGLAMEKGEAGTVCGSKTYAEGDTVSSQLLTYLSGTDIAGKETWGIYMVARSFVVYTDGTNELTVYSTNSDANNTDKFNAEFDSTGMVIRSVNQIIKSIAGTLTGATSEMCAANPGVSTAFTEEYAGVAYDTLTTLDENGLVMVSGVKDAEATVKMLVAYTDLIAAVVTAGN